jgi:hypothetical protein
VSRYSSGKLSASTTHVAGADDGVAGAGGATSTAHSSRRERKIPGIKRSTTHTAGADGVAGAGGGFATSTGAVLHIRTM